MLEEPAAEVLVKAAHPVKPLDCADPALAVLDDAAADV